jgi:hypothetical protein
MGTADELRARTAEAWATFRSAIDERALDEATPAGWTAKEMAAHVAFWLETTPPFVTGAFRGRPSAFETTFPSGYAPPDDGTWPAADVHNAREAAWAREQDGPEVLARLDAAYAELASFLGTVTDDEATTHAGYFADIAGHLDNHRRSELEPPA